MDFRALLCHQWGLCGYYEPNLCVFAAIINSKSETVEGAYYDLLLAKKQHGKTCKRLDNFEQKLGKILSGFIS